MKIIKEYHTFINENSSILKVSENDLDTLFKGDTITIDGNPISFGRNVYEYDLIRLAQGSIVDIDDCNCKMLLDDNIIFKTIKNIVKNSPLNIEGAMFGMFLETHPMKSNQ